MLKNIKLHIPEPINIHISLSLIFKREGCFISSTTSIVRVVIKALIVTICTEVKSSASIQRVNMLIVPQNAVERSIKASPFEIDALFIY